MDSEFDQIVRAISTAYSTDPEQSKWALTPRMACRLLIQARFVADIALDPDYLTGTTFVLPPIALRQATPAFLTRFARCFDDLAQRIAYPGGAEVLTACTGDEVALDHVLELARGAYLDGTELDMIGELFDKLPVSPELDDDFDFYADVLFLDRDFELLWQPELDGIEGDEPAEALCLVNLKPDRWFLPFDSAT